MTSGLTLVILALCGAALAVSVSALGVARAQTPSQAAQTPPQAAQAPAPTDTDHGTALMLLDRVATLLDAAVSGKSRKSGAVATSGSDDAQVKVVMDRAAVDEIRAEVAQIKLLLTNEPKSSVALRPREKPEGAR
jgi:hypothetical protein